MIWQPISLEELYDDILSAEIKMRSEIERLWELVKIFPEKWQYDTYGSGEDSFWVVAVCGRHIIWYDDIEEHFCLSEYNTYGHFGQNTAHGVAAGLQNNVQALLARIQFH
ncbi:hypothetical protein [Hymenobacter canadensis]|uniref:Uncharacterized protein n=1 Tax=Hymenobacter canadensis TaxID=2999067 RepID=A0ABY7LNM0_9BACT|nr:hypothetical protein [Hymenobacter canadensis]WBA42032.1 hypothetical protein O3303_00375 [Hymenobacter canadensis]